MRTISLVPSSAAVFSFALVSFISSITFVSRADAAEGASDITFTASEAIRSSGFPLSNAVEADGWVFLSGALGTSPGQGLAPGGIEPETRQTMENIKTLLADLNLGMDRVVKCTVMLADMAEWSAFNKVYAEFFEDTYPARSAFGVNGLAANARVEVECIAKR